ncbi:complement C1q tumor necrosis factor-related protein 6-like [Ruditapes philippinarum]|uniref:complement C1q tumor necrosis factor-related protein 6-like n=1 Tax=Ruditapes philippinarum TaxID=129788 RepID=UPI00295A9FFA|nr:complement C1q tumor necrosis factor-related protein 6-like [Ruditapes philippinarum]
MFNYGNMSLSKYLTEYFSDEESGAISDSEEEGQADAKPKPKDWRPSTFLSLDFSVHLSVSLSNVTPYRAIRFDTVDTNHDDCYNVTTGRFTAPLKGLYVFFATITTTERLKATLCFIHKFHPVDQSKVKEREQLIEGFNSKTIAVVLTLDKEDDVWVLNVSKVSDVNQMQEPYYTSFSGGLVDKLTSD